MRQQLLTLVSGGIATVFSGALCPLILQEETVQEKWFMTTSIFCGSHYHRRGEALQTWIGTRTGESLPLDASLFGRLRFEGASALVHMQTHSCQSSWNE